MQRPVIEFYNNIAVVRDDLVPGGTKSRFLLPYFKNSEANEFIYATPAEGGAQVAIAICAYQAAKEATLFVAKRKKRSIYTQQAASYGAKIVEISPGYLNVVQAKAKQYAEERGAKLIPFGLQWQEAITAISNVGKQIDFDPEEVWCACGSGVLSTALKAAFPKAKIKAVQVGRDSDLAAYQYDRDFSQKARTTPPFPSNPHYDAKAWEICTANNNRGKVLFWNVAS
ncbi:hypothetical protein [uncultured Kiloniella sp.]|uniref:hypothetical protein n=1 Tax=uncultured Kiloniella sp. TaxID=1133091 RepID=UPI00260EDC19|nr:hypothetical protein [uncultured Kiloniella sp.]